jgi:cytochrome c553
MVDLKNGARGGRSVELIGAVVEKLTSDDMLAIAAYAASLNP